MRFIGKFAVLFIVGIFSACGDSRPPCFTKAGGYYGTAVLKKNECPVLQPETMEGYVTWPLVREVRECGPAGGIQDRHYDYLVDCDIFYIVDAMATEDKMRGSLIIMWSCMEGGIGYMFMQNPLKHPDFKCDSAKDDDCKSTCEDKYEFEVEYKPAETTE